MRVLYAPLTLTSGALARADKGECGLSDTRAGRGAVSPLNRSREYRPEKRPKSGVGNDKSRCRSAAF
ncbi:MAG: hypothetical protein LBP79_04760 [Clostridiales bacterium]|nr:hypothetical protein [Clostridiales bacterium]